MKATNCLASGAVLTAELYYSAFNLTMKLSRCSSYVVLFISISDTLSDILIISISVT